MAHSCQSTYQLQWPLPWLDASNHWFYPIIPNGIGNNADTTTIPTKFDIRAPQNESLLHR